MRIVVPDLLPGRNYAIQVRATSMDGPSEWSPRFEVTTAEDSTLPQAPTNVTWVVSGDSFYGEWDSVAVNVNNDFALITRYEIEMVGNGVTKTVSVPQKTGSRIGYALSFEENRALFNNPAATVTMRVRAVDNKNLKGNFSAIKSATNPPPGPVTDLEAVGVTDAVNLNWVAPGDNDLIGFNIYASVTPNFPAGSNNKAGFTPGSFYQHTTSNYTTWHYVVRAVDKFGSESTDVRASAAPISPFGVDVEPPEPPTITSVNIDTDDATLRTTAKVDWSYPDPPSDLAEFVIRYREAGTTPWETKTVASTADQLSLSETLTNLKPYVNYEVQMQARDFTANGSDWTGTTTGTAEQNIAPSTPATPSASANTMQIQVSHTGNRATGAAMEPDVVHYEVYASKTSGFTTYNTTTMLGTLPAGPAIVGTFDVPAAGSGTATNERWYVKVIAVDRGGLKSPASGQAQADVGLISTTNIGHAQITSAKIAELEANKIVAGTGFVNDITVKSTFTLGDANTNGEIKSHGYVSDSKGFRLTKTGLELNEGAVKAAALKIQNSHNLMPVQYADFEWGDAYYIDPFWNGRGQRGISAQSCLANAGEAPSVFGKQRLSVLTFSASDQPIFWLGKSDVDYNIEVEPGVKYILSAYLKNHHPTATTWNMRIKGSNGSIFFTQPISMSGGQANYTRYQWVITIPSGVTKILVGMNNTSTAAAKEIWMDGVQFERVEAGLEEASPWHPPASTSIEGAGVTTGFLRSSQNITVNGSQQPLWSINMAGAAQFGDASVRGKIIVGPPSGTDGGNSFIASGNFVEASTGWKIRDDGVAEFSNITSRASNGTRTEISNAANPYESGQQWNVIAMHSDNAAWSPAQIWVNHIPGNPNLGMMSITSPKLGAREPAKINLWSEEQTNSTGILFAAQKFETSAQQYYFGNNVSRRIMQMDSNTVAWTANTYKFGDPNGTALVFKMDYTDSDMTQTWSFRSPGNKRFNVSFGDFGKIQLATNAEDNSRTRMDLAGSEIAFLTSSTNGNIILTNLNQMTNRPAFAHMGINSAVGFFGEEIRFTSLNGGAYVDGRAARWLTPSDMSHKDNIQEVNQKVRKKMKSLKVYDYERKPHVKMSAKEVAEAERLGLSKKKRQRGLSAQEIQKVFPEVVVDDEESGSGLAVDLYGLLSSTIKALNELQDEVDDLQEQLASKGKK